MTRDSERENGLFVATVMTTGAVAAMAAASFGFYTHDAVARLLLRSVDNNDGNARVEDKLSKMEQSMQQQQERETSVLNQMSMMMDMTNTKLGHLAGARTPPLAALGDAKALDHDAAAEAGRPLKAIMIIMIAMMTHTYTPPPLPHKVGLYYSLRNERGRHLARRHAISAIGHGVGHVDDIDESSAFDGAVAITARLLHRDRLILIESNGVMVGEVAAGDGDGLGLDLGPLNVDFA